MMLLLLLVCGALGFQNPSQVITQRITHDAVKSDSPRFRNWIRIPLHPELIELFDGQTPLIKRVLWCRSVSLPGSTSTRNADPSNLLRSMSLVEPNPTEFGCASPGFAHFQMYPGSRMMTHQPEDEPQTLYVDPSEFGGLWDEKHEMEVVVDLRVTPTHTAQHVVRFNFTPKKPVTSYEHRTQHPWKSVLAILVGGMVFFACMAYIMYRSRLEKPKLNKPYEDTDEEVLERMKLTYP